MSPEPGHRTPDPGLCLSLRMRHADLIGVRLGERARVRQRDAVVAERVGGGLVGSPCVAALVLSANVHVELSQTPTPSPNTCVLTGPTLSITMLMVPPEAVGNAWVAMPPMAMVPL